jgi:phosphohistidine phosphatase
MKQLVLVRHAHAQGHPPGFEDFERRLDEKGRREAEAMARRTRELAFVPDHLISSPADRAIATAREFAKALGFPLPRIRHDDRVYLAEPQQLIAIVRAVPDEIERVLLVGHNPGLTQFAEWLTGDDLGALPTAAVYGVRIDVARWADLQRETAERSHYDYPP